MRVRSARQRSSGPSSPNSSAARIGPVHRHPGHRLGERELPRPAPHFPDALVRLLPDVLQVLHQGGHQVPAFACGGTSPPCTSWYSASSNFAVDVELHLRAGGVADAHRARALVAAQPRHLPFHDPALAGQAVQRLHLRRRAGDAAAQPVAPGARLVLVAGVHQRHQREGGVAQPADSGSPSCAGRRIAPAARWWARRRCRRLAHSSAPSA